MPDQEFVEQLWVCTGKALSTDKKVGYVFSRIDGPVPGVRHGEYFFLLKGMAKPSVGSVYKVVVAENGERMKSLNYHGPHEDQNQAHEWRMKADEFDIKQRLKKREKFENAQFEFSVLDPIRRAYWSTDTLGQCAIEAQVLYYLRAGKKPEVK